MVHALMDVSLFRGLDGALKPGLRLGKAALARQANAHLMQADGQARVVHTPADISLLRGLDGSGTPQMGFLELSGV